jgi:hypothetical protein
VLVAGPIEAAAVGHIRAGGDLCLICHQESLIVRAYEAMTREAKRDRRFRHRAQESARRVAAFKKKNRNLARGVPPPTSEKIAKLSRQIWEFTEQVRLESL